MPIPFILSAANQNEELPELTNEWTKYFNQLFLSFILILQKIKINNDGYIFLISSQTIKTPEDRLVLSNSYRVALSSILKQLLSYIQKLYKLY